MTEKTRPARSGGRPWIRLAGLLLAITIGVGVLVAAFVWPTASSSPKNVPIAVAPAAAAGQVSAVLAGHVPAGAVEIRPVADRDSAEAAIRSREVYGAIVVGPAGPVVLKAGAASPAVAQLLDQLAAALGAAGAPGVPGAPGAPGSAGSSGTSGAAGSSGSTGSAAEPGAQPGGAVDVVPSPSGDPHGAGFAIAIIPLTLAGLVLGAVLGLAVRPRVLRLVGLAVGSLAGGLLVAWLLHALGVLNGSYLPGAAVIATTIAAVAAVTLGALALARPSGIAPVAAVMVLLGVPLSGAMSAPELLPTFWGELGQWLPPGAAITLLRTVSFFPDAAHAGPAWVLTGWLVLGLVAVMLGRAPRVGAVDDARRAHSGPTPGAGSTADESGAGRVVGDVSAALTGAP